MKSENILADIKSKSLKEAKEEISQILSKLENKDINLEESVKDYERLIKLNNHINELFRIKVKKISSVNKK
jgi:exodeoxyribonuclease VII small subunit|tara:strand:- start:105 stop:317 length:213 start_codon:yes stop_codon:yes gene_type:complete